MIYDIDEKSSCDMVPKTFKSKASSIFDVLNEVNFVSDYVELILK